MGQKKIVQEPLPEPLFVLFYKKNFDEIVFKSCDNNQEGCIEEIIGTSFQGEDAQFGLNEINVKQAQSMTPLRLQ